MKRNDDEKKDSQLILPLAVVSVLLVLAVLIPAIGEQGLFPDWCRAPTGAVYQCG